ncbi:MAG TPA: glutaredoxin family protein [Gaiellaceae bacterium]|jgi:glutaredoxin|nr:glutaredoxin family protein [Gaiellaceae bacterium]
MSTVPSGPAPPAPPQRPRKLVLYTAEGCHLCAAAKRVVEAARDELGFELEEVDIGGDDALEARYREWLPVVEIDGERAFTYFVEPDALRRKVAQSPGSGGTL